jgi:hypothetical protein
VAHLGERVAALVDGRLSPDAVDRAHLHLATCRPCREAVEAERLMKARLAALRGPEPSGDLMRRLLSMGGPNGPLPPRSGHVPGTPRPQPVTLPRPPAPVGQRTPVRSGLVRSAHAPSPGSVRSGLVRSGLVRSGLVRSGLVTAGLVAARPGGRPRPAGPGAGGSATGPGRGRSARRTRLAVAVLGALSVVGVGITGLVTSSAAGARTPTVVPPVDSFVVDHAGTTVNLPFVDVPAGWQLVRTGPDK